MNTKRFRLVSMLVIQFLLITSCSYGPCCYDPTKDQEVRFPRGIESYGDIRAYTFDPKTILTKIDLDQSDGTIFQRLPDLGQESVIPSGTFPWQQQDYLKIASAINHVAVQDSLEGWDVYSIHFSRDCADNPVGFDNFSITYFKTDGEQYITRVMEVWPLAKEADVGVDQPFPRPFPIGWKSLNLKNLKVTADEALQIAESNGGKAARQAVNNNCNIFVSLGENWYVTYERSGSGTYFQMSVNPYARK